MKVNKGSEWDLVLQILSPIEMPQAATTCTVSCKKMLLASSCFSKPTQMPLGIHGSVQLEVCLGPWLACLACYSLATRLRLNFFMASSTIQPVALGILAAFPFVALSCNHSPYHFIVQQVSGCWRKFCDSKKPQISMNNRKGPLRTTEATNTKWSCNSLSERWLSHWRGPSSVNLWFATRITLGGTSLQLKRVQLGI